jgi:nicotinamidase-related amidase
MYLSTGSTKSTIFGPQLGRDRSEPNEEYRMSRLPKNTTLVLIDLQKAIDHPSWGVRNNPQAESNVERLLLRWRDLNMPIIHVRHVSQRAHSTYRDGQAGVEFKEIAEPHAGEPVLTKNVCSAFIGTDLEARLRTMGSEDIVIVGVITNNSVEATARVSGDLGFRTFVVSDATFTFDQRDFTGRLRPAEDVHAMSLANLNGEYAEICTTDQVLQMTGT